MRSVRFVLLVTAIILTFSVIVMADDYDPKKAGHPLRLVAYVAHPVGVALDYAIFRPAHWVVHHEPLNTIFGHDAYDECGDEHACAKVETERE